MKSDTVAGGLQLRAAIVVSILTTLATAAQAQEAFELPAQPITEQPGLRLGTNIGAFWSDNIGRLAADEKSGTLGQVGVQLGYNERSRRLDANADVNAAYQHYFDNTFDDEVVGGINARAALQLVPDRLRWLVQENFGQINSDPFSASTPTNRENINYFTTGPELALRLGSVTSLRLAGYFSDTAYEVTDLDSRSYSGSASLRRELSGASSLSLNATGEKIEFDNTIVDRDYDRYQAFLRYELRGARTTLGVDGGYTQIDDNVKKSDGVLARLSLSRRLSASSTVSISAGSQFSAAGDLFRFDQQQRGVSLDSQSIIGASDAFKSRFASLGWGFDRNRTSLNLNVQYQDESYERSTTFDRTVTTYTGQLQRQISPITQLRLFAYLEREDFNNRNFTDDELQVGLALERQLGRKLGVRLQYDYFDRDSSNNVSNYQENRIGVFLTWSPLARP